MPYIFISLSYLFSFFILSFLLYSLYTFFLFYSLSSAAVADNETKVPDRFPLKYL